MNRIIKFRGKDIDTGKWLVGALIPNGKKEAYIAPFEKPLCLEGVNPDTVGQFTGYRDMDGTEIYEGDIVSVRNSVTATVEWRGGGFHFYGLEDTAGRRPDYVPSRGNQMRVIGNIYNNHVKLD